MGGRSGAEGRIPQQHVCGLKRGEEERCRCACCVCVWRVCKRWGKLLHGGWGPCHLSALAERRPGLESESSAGMCVLPSEGEARGERTETQGRVINTKTRVHVLAAEDFDVLETILKSYGLSQHI